MPAAPRRHAFADALTVFTRDTAGRGNWGHPGLARMLKDVGVDEARWKPTPDSHSIWEEVNHIVYWSRHVLDHLEGGYKPSKQAWPGGEGSADEWRRAVADAVKLHARLLKRIAALTPSAVRARYARSRYTTAQLVLGNASHVAYHVGQISVLKRLYRHGGRAA